ncbi:centromere protein T isoform X2 [Candoia aspera]|uniref:centromere protein T isoform X2 n=1 Tax=Candoia aspera TaxID=51853 RepID=UPI002FD82B94
MASRRSLRKQQPQEEPQGSRRSLRLSSKKAVPFSYQRSLAYQGPTTSAFMDFATPRTVFKKVLQTQPVVSPLVSEKTDSPKSTDTVFHFPVKASPSTNLEVNLSDSTQRDKSRIALHPTRSKKVRLSAFERDLNKQLHSSTAQGLLDSTSLTKSLQISFSTPAPLSSGGRKGLIRRPKNYRGVNVKDFEGGLEQDLLQIKDSQNYLEDLQAATLLSNDTQAYSAETKLFLQSHSSAENGTEPSNVPPELVLARQSLASRSMPPISQTPFARQDEMSDMEVERVAESGQKAILAPGSESAVEAETAPKEKSDRHKEGCQESPQDAGKGLVHSLAKEKLSPGAEDANSMESISMRRIVTPQRQQQKPFHGNSPVKEFFSPKKPLNTGMNAVRSSTPTDAEFPEAPQGHLSTCLSQRSVRRLVNEMVTHIIRGLDDIVPAVTGQGVAKGGLKDGLSLSESAIDISQRPRVGTPNRHSSGKTPKQLGRTPFKEMRDGTTPQMGDGSRTKEVLNVETEQVLGFEAENNPEVEEMSESENPEPTGNTPAFVHAKAFHCTPLLSSPYVLKEVAPRLLVKQSLVQRVPKPAKRVCRGKREPSLPSNLVKKTFTHYVKMPVAKDALEAVERCVNLYFKHLSNDLEAYVSHARRRTAEPADLELLMRRQGLITDNMPLNVLVERHLPMEYRKLLIPVAVSGNKVIPQKPR